MQWGLFVALFKAQGTPLTREQVDQLPGERYNARSHWFEQAHLSRLQVDIGNTGDGDR